MGKNYTSISVPTDVAERFYTLRGDKDSATFLRECLDAYEGHTDRVELTDDQQREIVNKVVNDVENNIERQFESLVSEQQRY
jgi:hypothetical protein